MRQVRIKEPFDASYGVSDPIWALTQLAQTTMRSELGKYSLDRTFSERDALNAAIVSTINAAASSWGIECLRYEIRDITPPASLLAAMALQAEAERRKRADILESEGRREAAVNTAEGVRRSTVLAAQGDAEATLARAHASAAAIEMLTTATGKAGAQRAVSLRIAEQYVAAFGGLARKGTTLILPSDTGNVGAMVAQALGVYTAVQGAGGARAARAAAASELHGGAELAGAAAGGDDDDHDGGGGGGGGGGAGAEGGASAGAATRSTDKLYQEAIRAVRAGGGSFNLDADGVALTERSGAGSSSSAAASSGSAFEPASYAISSAAAADRLPRA